MEYKLIVLDLDGTLKNSKNEISPRTKKALMNAQAKGIKIMLSSGRPTMGIRFDATDLELDKYGGFISSYNGAKISNFKTNEIYHEVPLDRIDAYNIYDFAVEEQVACMTYEGINIYTDAFGENDKYVNIEKSLNNFNIIVLDDFKANIPKVLPKLLLTGEPDYLQEVEIKAKERFPHLSICRSAPFFLEFMHNGIDKGSSLKKACEKLGYDLKNVIAFGDGYNDLTLIQTAGYGVAMANATKEVKEAADFITLSNDEDGIAEVLEKMVL